MKVADLLTSPSPPEWVLSSSKPTGGLDLMGLRVPVQTIEHELLSGITTITPRIRYLSLRAWVIKQYALARLPDSVSDFAEFAGRIEAAAVIGNLLAGHRPYGLVGYNRAVNLIESEEANLPLGHLVDLLAVFLYAGPSDQLHVTFPRPSGVPGITRERGARLADFVDECLGKTEFGTKLARNARVDTLSREALAEVGDSFRFDEVPDKECEILLSALIPDSPQGRDYGRVATYGLLLELAQRQASDVVEEDLFQVALAEKVDLPAVFQSTIDGWTRYLVRDSLATVHEASLEVVADELARRHEEGQVGSKAMNVLSALTTWDTEMMEPLVRLGICEHDDSILELPISELSSRIQRLCNGSKQHEAGLRRWSGPLDEWGIIKVALSGGVGRLVLLPVAWLLADWRVGPGVLEKLPGYEALSYQGWARLGAEQLIMPSVRELLEENLSLKHAVVKLAYESIRQHLRVAWARMASDPRRDVSVIVADGDRWFYRDRSRCGRTASRLNQAIGWLRQLGLIEERGITERGRAVLGKIHHCLAAQGNA